MRQSGPKNTLTPRGKAGQATIEYVLMLSTIVVMLSAFLTAFHKDIVRFFFQFIGQLLMS